MVHKGYTPTETVQKRKFKTELTLKTRLVINRDILETVQNEALKD